MSLAWALRTGATPVRDAIRECEELAQWRGTLHPGVLCELAHLRAMAGEFDSASQLITRARRLMTESMRLRRPLMFAAQSAAAVEALARDYDAAERELRAALGMALDFQERNEASKITAELRLSCPCRAVRRPRRSRRRVPTTRPRRGLRPKHCGAPRGHG